MVLKLFVVIHNHLKVLVINQPLPPLRIRERGTAPIQANAYLLLLALHSLLRLLRVSQLLVLANRRPPSALRRCERWWRLARPCSHFLHCFSRRRINARSHAPAMGVAQIRLGVGVMRIWTFVSFSSFGKSKRYISNFKAHQKAR